MNENKDIHAEFWPLIPAEMSGFGCEDAEENFVKIYIKYN